MPKPKAKHKTKFCEPTPAELIELDKLLEEEDEFDEKEFDDIESD